MHLSAAHFFPALFPITVFLIQKEPENRLILKLYKAQPRFELGVRVLQTRALPLGYCAIPNNEDYFSINLAVRQAVFLFFMSSRNVENVSSKCISEMSPPNAHLCHIDLVCSIPNISAAKAAKAGKERCTISGDTQ